MTTLIQSLLKRSDLDYSTFTDSVSKFRVSTPESLIDTDFEYGLQSIKWETVNLVNNIPLFFSRSGDTPIAVSNVTTTADTDYIYVTTASAHGFTDGAPIYIAGLKSVTAEGYYIVSKVLSTTQFVYRAKYTQTITGSLFDANTTYLFASMVYQGTGYSGDRLKHMITDETDSSSITVDTIVPHGFSVGTNFTLANTIGKRTIKFNGGNVASDRITIGIHNFYDGMQVVYTIGDGNVIGGLTNGNTYFIANAQSTSIQLRSSLGGSILPITPGNGLNHYFTSTDDASDGSFYNIISTTDTSFVLKADNDQSTTKILRNNLTFNPSTSVIQGLNLIVTTDHHKQLTGAPVVYTSTNGTAIGGLTVGETYYVIRNDLNSFRLAASYNDAIAASPIAVNITSSIDIGTSHVFTFPSILGETSSTGTVSISASSQIVTGSNVNFLSYFKPGDKFRIVSSTPAFTSYTITALDTSNKTLSLSATTTFTNGTPVRYVGGGTTNILNNVIYYVQVQSSTLIALCKTYTAAIGNQSADRIDVTGVSGAIQTVPLGSIFESTIAEVQNSTKIRLNTAPSTSLTNTPFIVPSSMYPFTDAYIQHRAHDGGIELIPSNNGDAQTIRQTRKYFRYQPGKGIQCSLSVNFNASIEIDYLSASGTTATARTRKPHRLTSGLSVTISNANESLFNGTFTVTVTSVNTFTYTLPSPAITTFASGYPVFSVPSWINSRIRAGLFDDQNGMFFEFDGSTLYCVRRDSVTQLSGLVNVTFGSQLVTKTSDTNTAFLSQLQVKQNVVIRGQTYRVVHIQDNDTIYIQPPYRGSTEQNVLVSVVTDTRAPQSSWSIDKCDGTGPTGYILNNKKIQMIYLDYSWYGAGKIRFGFKDTKGDVRYVHEFIHNNQLNQAYFRSGNLPARYEIFNVNVPTWVPPLLHWGTAVIMDGRYDDDKAYLFTASGSLLTYINGDQISIQGTIPTVSAYPTQVYDPYQQKSVTAYYIRTSGATGHQWKDVQNIRPGTSVTQGTYLAVGTKTVASPQRDNTNPNIALIFIDRAPLQAYTNTASPLTFTFGDATDIIPNQIPLVSIRIAPSVDSSITGPLGVRELVNRMQLRLRSVDLMTTNDTEIRLILNGFIDNKTFKPASSPSLSQIVVHNKGDTVQDGSILFSYRVPGGVNDTSGKRTSTVTNYDVSGLGYLGNSIQGGDSIYPDGPDVLTLVAVCLDPGGVCATSPYSVTARVSWAEAQA
jgi:hypothetical protein